MSVKIKSLRTDQFSIKIYSIEVWVIDCLNIKVRFEKTFFSKAKNFDFNPDFVSEREQIFQKEYSISILWQEAKNRSKKFFDESGLYNISKGGYIKYLAKSIYLNMIMDHYIQSINLKRQFARSIICKRWRKKDICLKIN